MSRIQEINKVLRGLQSGTPELEAAAVISEDGLLIASALPELERAVQRIQHVLDRP